MTDCHAKDKMIPVRRLVKVHAEASFKEAMGALKEAVKLGQESLAIMDDDGRLIGFLTIRLVLRALDTHVVKLPGYAWTAPCLSCSAAGRMRQIGRMRVWEIMRPLREIYVLEETPVQEVALLMIKNEIHNVPVVDRELKAVGIIRSASLVDIFDSFLED
ncbi:CBS domain-containing protein [Desulfofundulus thermobenzoicus]|uniref:CBS domain-containing protein n=1 Tax=Desulfofundulus thermobenzoicus TaxID=29376 RepID=A0A6N7INP7_9FIRM|nr:CBS domain-containing protein [Desulfofundulus thermobenzoicus]MQL51227.1 CBS domain-containing protein [Desulfofundulus thermobenzoicus]